MRNKQKKKATTKLHLITAVGHVASIRPDCGEFFNPRQIRVTGSTARGLCTFVSRDSIGIVARPIEIADRDRDRLVVFLFRFIDVSLLELTSAPLLLPPLFLPSFFPFPHFHFILRLTDFVTMTSMEVYLKKECTIRGHNIGMHLFMFILTTISTTRVFVDYFEICLTNNVIRELLRIFAR